jgi:hypothetical protein
MSGRPGEVSARWVARQLGRHVKTVRRWCAAELVACRPEYGHRRKDGARHVIQYWISGDDADRLISQGQQNSGSEI